MESGGRPPVGSHQLCLWLLWVGSKLLLLAAPLRSTCVCVCVCVCERERERERERGEEAASIRLVKETRL